MSLQQRKRNSNWKRKIKREKKKKHNKTAAEIVNFANNLKKGMKALMWCNVFLYRWNITLLIKMQIFIVCNNLRLLIYGLLFVTHCHSSTAGRIFGKFLLHAFVLDSFFSWRIDLPICSIVRHSIWHICEFYGYFFAFVCYQLSILYIQFILRCKHSYIYTILPTIYID